MTDAVNAVNSGMSVRKAAETFSVPKSTLSDRVTGRVKPGSTWGKTPKLPATDEDALITAATARAEKGLGFSKNNFLRYVGIFAGEKGNAFKNGRPTDMWWRKLKSRHPGFSLRSPEATAANRHAAMNKERIGIYFNDLKQVLDQHQFHQTPDRIWNMDETGMQLAHKPNRVLAAKGSRSVHGRASISRETITVIACGNALGRSIPPYFIVPGKTTKKLHGFDTESCRETTSPLFGSKFSVSESGWTKEGIAQLWFANHFIPNIGPVRPQLLIFDGHGSHNNTEIIKLARQENIILGELPSHTSHWTQPFDRAVFKSLKSSWNSHIDNYIKCTGVSVGNASFLRVFGKAWADSVTPHNIVSGFKATGIHPYNPNAIPEIAFKPATDENDITVPALGIEQAGNSLCGPKISSSSEKENENPHAQTPTEPQESSNTQQDWSLDEATSLFNILLPVGESTVDLPLQVTENGLLEETRKSNDGGMEQTITGYDLQPVTDLQALEVIEASLTSETIIKYCAAYISGADINNDPKYHTWKMYKGKCTSTTTSPMEIMKKHFPLPKKTTKTAKRKIENSQYFVISADEIYLQKVKKDDEKRQKEIAKELRKLEREQKKKLQQLNKQDKKPKGKSVTSANSDI